MCAPDSSEETLEVAVNLNLCFILVLDILIWISKAPFTDLV